MARAFSSDLPVGGTALGIDGIDRAVVAFKDDWLLGAPSSLSPRDDGARESCCLFHAGMELVS